MCFKRVLMNESIYSYETKLGKINLCTSLTLYVIGIPMLILMELLRLD